MTVYYVVMLHNREVASARGEPKGPVLTGAQTILRSIPKLRQAAFRERMSPSAPLVS